MRTSVISLSKKLISTFFAATLAMGLVPASAFAANDDNGEDESTTSVISTEASDSERNGEISPTEDIKDESTDLVISSDSEKSDPDPSSVGAEPAPRDEEDTTEDNAQASGDDNPAMTIPAATERINEDVMLTTPVAQQETTKNYFLAQTLESTRTIPIVSANLPLDKGPIDVETTESNAEGEDSNTSEEEDGESSDDPDDADDLATADDSITDVISTEASDSERSGEISTPVAAASTVIGSFTYRGITYAVEPGGETVAIVAADYAKLPEDFISAQAIVLPSMVTPDGIDYYSVTRIADYAFSSLNTRVISTEASVSERSGEISSQEGEDSNAESESAYIDAITVPASVTEIGDNAYADFNTLQYIIVSDDNPEYSQYDGCLYTADQSRLLFIPEGRLGAVRVAPNVTEVSPEAFSHCPSVDTLVADPASAAYQLFEGMNDIEIELKTESEGIATAFTCAELDSVQNESDVLAVARSHLDEDVQNIELLLASSTLGCVEGLIRSEASFVVASILNKTDSSSSVSTATRAAQNADDDFQGAYANGTAGITYASYDSLPSWIKKAIGVSTTTNEMYKFNAKDINKIVLYGASGFSAKKPITTALAAQRHPCTVSYGRYASTASHAYKSTATVPTAIGGYGDTSTYNSNINMYTYVENANNSLWFDPTFGLVPVGDGSRDNGEVYPLLRVAWAGATSGNAIRSRYALVVTYNAAATMYRNVTIKKPENFIILPPEFKVTWNGNGGTSEESSWLVPSGNTAKLGDYSTALPKAARSGYIHNGWSTNTSGTDTVTAATTLDGDTTFYAKWTTQPYGIYYTMNGGTNNSLNPSTYTWGDVVTLYAPSRFGYTFKGWSGTGLSGDANTSVTIPRGSEGTRYFTANWTANTYYVDYYGNGATSGNTARSAHTYGISSQLNLNGYLRAGYTFKGWATSSTGDVVYGDRAWVSTLTSTANGIYSLYAKWTINVYNINVYCPVKTAYNTTGSDSSLTGSSTSDGYVFKTTVFNSWEIYGAHSSNGQYITLRNWEPTQRTIDVHNFRSTEVGKYVNKRFYSYSNLTGAVGPALQQYYDVTLYLGWGYTNYTLTYGANGGSGSHASVMGQSINNSVTLPSDTNCGITRAGWTLTGWKVGSSTYNPGATVAVSTLASAAGKQANQTSDTITLDAQWTINTYTVNVYCPVNTTHIVGEHTNGVLQNNYGQASSDGYALAMTSVNYFSVNGTQPNQYISPCNATAGRHNNEHSYSSTEVGKYVNNSFFWDEARTQPVAAGIYYQNATLYLGWGLTNYTVAYGANGGSGSQGSLTGLTMNFVVILPTVDNCLIWKPGYTLSGWKIGSSTYAPGYTVGVSDLAAAAGAQANKTADTLTLDAQWKANDYTITFDANGGSGGITGPIDVTYDSALPKLEGDWKPTAPEGYEFNGWWDTDAKTGGNQYYGPSGEATQTTYNLVADNVTLYARWSRLPFHAITLKDERLDVKDGSIWFWPPTKGYTPDDPNKFPVDGTKDHLIRIASKDNKIADLTDPIFSDEDYEFLGYFDKKQGEEGAIQKIDADGNLKTDEPITGATVWYAHWTRHGATVKLQADYGEMVSEDIVQGTDRIDHVSFGKDFATPTGEDATRIETIEKTPTRVGYTFMGYYTDENPELSTEDVEKGNFKGTRWIYGEGEVDKQSGELVANEWPSEEDWNKLGLDDEEDTNTVVLYAAWQLDDCIVKFNTDTDDGTEPVVREEGALQDRIWHYNKNMSDILPTPSNDGFSRNGYDFGGWYYIDDDGTEKRVCDKDGTPTEVLLPWTDPTKNVTLYAYWIPRHYALEFLPAFPNVEGVEQVYEGERTIEDIAYDEKLMMVPPDFGAYDFAGWYVGVPDELGGWKASDVPFADWTLRSGELKEGEHTTDVAEKDGAYLGRFTPQEPLVSQFLVEGASEQPVIHVVAKWEDPVEHYFTLYVGEPGGGEDALLRRDDPEPYYFAEPYAFDETWAPGRVAGWEFEGWVEVGSDDATDEENVKAALDAIERGDTFEGIGGATGIEPKTTRASYRNLHYVAKWTICPMSVTLSSTENEDGFYVKATDTMTYPKEEGSLLSWDEVATTDGSYKAVYDVRDKSFTLPDLTRRGYDFKGWRLQGGDGHVWPRVTVDPAEQAKDKTGYHRVYEPVFEVITYRIILKANNTDPYTGKLQETGDLEDQTFERAYTEEFTFPYPVALNTGGVFSAWATKSKRPSSSSKETDYREFFQAKTYPMSPGVDENGKPTFCLSDLTTDEERTIVLYAIYNGSYNVTVPLVANMAIDTETGDVVAGRTRLWDDKEGVTYTVESLRYEPVKDVATGQVPFQGAYEVYFSIYPGLSFQNDADAYYFLQKSKVGDKGAVTYADKEKDGEDTTVEPILVKLGGTDATPKLFTRTSLSNDPNEVTLDSVTGDTYGFYSFGKDKPLDVYYGIHFADPTTMKDTLKRFSFKENATTWTLPKNDAGNQTDTTNGRKLGWSSGRVDIAKVRYTLSMTKTTPEPTE